MKSQLAVAITLCTPILPTVPLRGADAQERLVFAESFEHDAARWKPFTETSKWSLDEAQGAPGGHSVKITGNRRSAIQSGEVNLAEPFPTALICSFRGLREPGCPDARVGICLKVVLDKGGIVWFSSDDLKLPTTAAGDWHLRTATYVADVGLRVRAFEVFCLNYDSTISAWFGDIRVAAAGGLAPAAAIVVLEHRNNAADARGRFVDALKTAGLEYQSAPYYSDVSKCALVVAPEWVEDVALHLRLKLAHYCGARLVFGALSQSRLADAIALYFWNRRASELGEQLHRSEDGRALYLPAGVALDPNEITSLLRVNVHMPETIPADEPGAKPKQEIRAGRLLIDEQPAFIRMVGIYLFDNHTALGEHEAPLSEYERLGFNALGVSIAHDVDVERLTGLLDAATGHHMRCLMIMHGPRVRGLTGNPMKDEWMFRLLRLRNHPALLGYLLCDDTFYRQYDFVERTANIVRRYDRLNLLTTTVMDTRRPERVPKQAWDQLKRICDFPTPYVYPLQKGETYGGGEDIKGGLEDVQRLSDNTRAVLGPDVYIMQWSQAHMQTPAYRKVGLHPKETFLASPEQQRLLAYMILSSGARGIAYFRDAFLRDAGLGVGRRCELGLVHHELKPVETLIAGGDWGRIVEPTARDDGRVEGLEVSAYSDGTSIAALLVHHEKDQNRCVRKGETTPVRFTVPWRDDGRPQAIRLLPGAAAATVSVTGDRRVEVAVPDFDLAEPILLTSDPRLMQSVLHTLEVTTRLAAELALAVLFDKRVKTELVCEKISQEVPVDLRGLLDAAATASERARALLEQGELGRSYKASRRAMLLYRRVQAGLIDRAWQYAQETDLPGSAWLKLNIFYSLPVFYEQYKGGRKLKPQELREAYLQRWKAVDVPGLQAL